MENTDKKINRNKLKNLFEKAQKAQAKFDKAKSDLLEYKEKCWGFDDFGCVEGRELPNSVDFKTFCEKELISETDFK